MSFVDTSNKDRSYLFSSAKSIDQQRFLDGAFTIGYADIELGRYDYGYRAEI